MANYKLRPHAEADLEKIWSYTIAEWDVVQADSYIDEIDDVFALLAKQPLISRERLEFTPPVRIHPHGHHLIVYLIVETDIEIIRVLHESMDIQTQIKEE